MNAHSPTPLVRHAFTTVGCIRQYATSRHQKSKPSPEPEVSPEPETSETFDISDARGRQIFVYKHLQKNHVVYSLTRSLKNNKALSQLPFNGKKTVPRALRKDHWTPFCTLSLPSGPITLSVFQKLRELRRRHELEWTPYTLFTEGKELETYLNGDQDRWDGRRELSEKQKGKKRDRERRKMVGRKLCDQVANSVADMAFVLGRLGVVDEGGEKEGNEENEGKEQKVAVTRVEMKKNNKVPMTKELYQKMKKAMVKELGEKDKRTVRGHRIGLEGEGTGAKVGIMWMDVQDAEFARSWSRNVEHGALEARNRVLQEEVVDEEEAYEDVGGYASGNASEEVKEGLWTKLRRRII